MNSDANNHEEYSLDPEDWGPLQAIGHRMVDDSVAFLRDIRERPVWKEMPLEVEAFFESGLPHEAQPIEAVYEEFLENIREYPMGNIHPRFWGWVMGNGSLTGAYADFLASVVNSNMGGGNHAPRLVEAQVINWCKEMVGFPAESSGLLTSGASMANFTALAVARNQKALIDVRKKGVGALPKTMRAYTSAEVHSCHIKAIEQLGIGSDNLQLIPVNADYEMDIEALEAAIAADKAAGMHPYCVIATAGTVNTGAFDDFEAIAAICQREGLWMHVDGAFGALLALLPQHQEQIKGMALADSICFDMHKWLYMPFEIAVVLVKDSQAHRDSFALVPVYLEQNLRGVGAGTLWYSDYGLQLSRGFRALKVWMSVKELGIDHYAKCIEMNIQQARYLGELIAAEAHLETVAPIPLNIVCFRYVEDGLSEEALNQLNRELLLRLHESGEAVPTYTTLNGRYCLRAAISNARSRFEDFDHLVAVVLKIGAEIAPNYRAL